MAIMLVGALLPIFAVQYSVEGLRSVLPFVFFLTLSGLLAFHLITNDHHLQFFAILLRRKWHFEVLWAIGIVFTAFAGVSVAYQLESIGSRLSAAPGPSLVIYAASMILGLYAGTLFRKNLTTDLYVWNDSRISQSVISALGFVAPIIILAAVSLLGPDVSILAIFCFGVRFLFSQYVLAQQERRSKCREAFLRDTLGFPPTGGKNPTTRAILDLLLRGRIRLAQAALSWLYHDYDRDYYKLACRVRYYLQDYAGAISVARSHLASPQYSKSATLASLTALSMSHLGLVEEAENLLKRALDDTSAAEVGNQAAAYFQVNLSRIAWQRGDVDRALQLLETVSAQDPFKVCPQICRMRARYLCDKILHDLYGQPNSVVASEFITDKLKSVESILAASREELEARGQISFVHLDGLVALLRRNYDVAVRHFADAILCEGHCGSRLHLALIHMIGTRTYHSAEYQLKATLAGLTHVYDGNSFKRQVLRNLSRIRAARSEGVVFNEDIVYYHLQEVLLPERAIIAAESIASYERERLRVLQLTFKSFWVGAITATLGRGKKVGSFAFHPKTQ
jgi:tetratricopeptide (TPR) repeat protein